MSAQADTSKAIGALADYINSSLCDAANSLDELAKEGGTA